MKKKWVLLACTYAFCGAALCPANEPTLQESMELRRIVEYWKEKEFHVTKKQILSFLQNHPETAAKDQLHAMLGDILFEENNFSEALHCYEQVAGEELKESVEFGRLNCLFQLEKSAPFVEGAVAFLKHPNSTKAQIEDIRLELAAVYFRNGVQSMDKPSKSKWFGLAQEQYKALAKSRYTEEALLPLAQIHIFFEEYPRAAALYGVLAEHDARNREEFLIQTAMAQLKFDRGAAMETFGKIWAMGGRKASLAAFNHLSLLFQEKRYRDLLSVQEKAKIHIHAEQLPQVHYFIGKSLFHVGDHTNAKTYLAQVVATPAIEQELAKNALQTLLQCAKETKDLPLVDQVIGELDRHFENDTLTAHAYLLRAHFAREASLIEKAAVDMRTVLQRFPYLPERENLLYDHALLLVTQQQWQESAAWLESYLKEFPKGKKAKNVWRHLINCELKNVELAHTETARMQKEKLNDTVSAALEQDRVFSGAERQKLRFLRAKTLFELEDYEMALGELVEYVRDFPHEAFTSEAYLMTAYAYEHHEHDLFQFAINAERALELNPELVCGHELHLKLFNTYLCLAERMRDVEKRDMLLKAADHLFISMPRGIKKDNELWLANFYFLQYKRADGERSLFLNRTVAVMEHLLHLDPQAVALTLDTSQMEMEGEALKLADLYADQANWDRAIALLSSLNQEQRERQDAKWKYQRLAQFKLAKSYQAKGDYSQALATYNYLIETSSHIHSYFASAAQLEKALLEYALLPAAQRLESSPEVKLIYASLKDLEAKRRLYSEPFHLEAALAYVDIKVALAAPEEQAEKKLSLLKQMQSSFFQADDPLVKAYLAAAHEFPEKAQLYEQYAAFVDAEIQRLEASASPEAEAALDHLSALSVKITDEHLKTRIETVRNQKR